MNTVLRRLTMTVTTALVFSICGTFVANAQVGTSNTKTLSVKSVTTTQIEYQLTLTKPEVSIDAVTKEFLSKSGIKSCTPVKGANQLLIVTESNITHEMIMGIVDVTGCQETYHQYKTELAANRAQPKKVEVRTE